MALVLPCATRARAEAPAYLVRGDAVEARYNAYRDRLDRFHDALATALKDDSPDLSLELKPAQKIASGYRILPKLVPDPPFPDRSHRSEAAIYSWPWTEKLIERELDAITAREADLGRTATLEGTERRAAHEKLVADYKKMVEQQRTIGAHLNYNRFWQLRIAADKAGYEISNKLERATLDRQAIRDALSAPDEATIRKRIAGLSDVDAGAKRASLEIELRRREAALGRELEEASGSLVAGAFVRLEQSGPHAWIVHVPFYTDIEDEEFLRSFRAAAESVWRLHDGETDYRTVVEVAPISPKRLYAGQAVPAKGDAIDVHRHVGLFPKDRAILTTGAVSLHVIGGRAIVLGPHDVSPHALAHELGHVLGFQDRYFRGYRDLGADGFEVREVVADPDDIMGAPGFGPVLRRHFEKLIAALSVQTLMEAGLDALYKQNDPVAAAARFRKILEVSPRHYGATFQLAKALDTSGSKREALVLWRKVLEMAEAAKDEKTAKTARERIGTGG